MAKSLHDAVDSQQYTRRDNQAGFDAGCADNQQGTRSECRTQTRCTANSREMCTEARSAAARRVFADRRSDFFASTRKNLDLFHAGIIVRNGNRMLVRHASRSQGFVVERELSEFLKANRMAGVIIVGSQGVTRRIAQTEVGAKLRGGS
jgi:hypothetical protein